MGLYKFRVQCVRLSVGKKNFSVLNPRDKLSTLLWWGLGHGPPSSYLDDEVLDLKQGTSMCYKVTLWLLGGLAEVESNIGMDDERKRVPFLNSANHTRQKSRVSEVLISSNMETL